MYALYDTCGVMWWSKMAFDLTYMSHSLFLSFSSQEFLQTSVELPPITCRKAHPSLSLSLSCPAPVFSLLSSFLPLFTSLPLSGASVWTALWTEWWSGTTTSTWPTSLRGSSLFSSPLSWRSRDTASTWRRWPPCSNPNTRTSFWWETRMQLLFSFVPAVI